jgi:hypothetical protein
MTVMGSIFAGWSFVEIAKIHDFKYDYSKADRTNAGTIIVICQKHGEFTTTIVKHKHGEGCPECAAIAERKRLDAEFSALVKQYNEKYNFKYNYVGSVYHSMGRKITIECPTHGTFQQTPKQHLEFTGCKLCRAKRGKKKLVEKEDLKKNLIDAQKEVLIESFKAVFGMKYNYDLFVYRGINKKIIIQCPEHGIFRSTPLDHIRGDYCPSCRKEKIGL